MNWRNLVATLGCAVALTACAPHVHTLIADRPNTAGRMQHWTAGDGWLEIQHEGKIYSGEINAEGIRRIRGERQRFPGWIATPVLVAADGDKIICDLKWGRGKLPAGSCKDADGAKFDVRFE